MEYAEELQRLCIKQCTTKDKPDCYGNCVEMVQVIHGSLIGIRTGTDQFKAPLLRASKYGELPN